MSFAVYFPGKTGANVQHFHDAGLADLLDDVAPDFATFDFGPDHGPGVVAHWLKRPVIMGEFDWTPFPPRPDGRATHPARFFLGRGEGCGPQSFARAHRQLGEDLVLADGQAWHVPHARQLPSVLQLDEAGHWRGKIAPSYQQFWERAWLALEWFAPNEEGICSIDFQAGADFAALALSVNYRINRDLASWLGLIRSDLLFRVVEIVTQYKDLLQAGTEKKTVSPGSPTAAGAAA